jgi:hypothetical protein
MNPVLGVGKDIQENPGNFDDEDVNAADDDDN